MRWGKVRTLPKLAAVAGQPHRPEAGRQKAEPGRTTWLFEVMLAHEGFMRCCLLRLSRDILLDLLDRSVLWRLLLEEQREKSADRTEKAPVHSGCVSERRHLLFARCFCFVVGPWTA